MIKLLSSIFIKNHEQTDSAQVRRQLGILCAFVGIGLNVIMFGGKLAAGIISGSVAIKSDSVNNLMDAFSSIVTFLGFRLAAKKPDVKHPFGHGRFEYVSGLAVSVSILVIGFELARGSIESIITPDPPSFDTLSLAIPALCIPIKLYMSWYNRRIGKKIGSQTMLAVSADSISDALATTAVVASAVVYKYFRINTDGWAGLVVSLFIIYTGIGSIRETVAPLLGTSPDKEFVEKIKTIVLSHEEITSMHDLVVHDYGPGRRMISLHAEIPSDMDILHAHDIIDDIEIDLSRELECHAVIHMDPVNVNDSETNRMRDVVAGCAKKIDPRVTVHDLRIVSGKLHTNIIFDAVLPYDCKYSETQFTELLKTGVAAVDERYRCVITVDREYV
ncbi:MAG: cation transporter [Clostridia bacterium]|nr:cation transporter [Clostridia bacterium]